MATAYDNGQGLTYPLTKMNFLVSIPDGGTAAFSEVTGIEAAADVIEFRQGNSHILSPVKLSGLVKHGNITLKFGFTESNTFKDYLKKSVSDVRSAALERKDITIELIDVNKGVGSSAYSTVTTAANTWVLKNAWVCKYTAPDLNALQSEVAIESVEIAYEVLQIGGAPTS